MLGMLVRLTLNWRSVLVLGVTNAPFTGLLFSSSNAQVRHVMYEYQGLKTDFPCPRMLGGESKRQLWGIEFTQS